MLYSLGSFRCSEDGSLASRLKTFIVPLLTGTSPSGARFEIREYPTRIIRLNPLSFQAMWSIVNEECNSDGKLTELLMNIQFRILIADLGGNQFEFFFTL